MVRAMINVAAFNEFACRVCGRDAFVSFIEPTAHEDLEHGKAHFQAWCIKCCPGHLWLNEPGEGLMCKYCSDQPPYDYYDYEPDDWQ